MAKTRYQRSKSGLLVPNFWLPKSQRNPFDRQEPWDARRFMGHRRPGKAGCCPDDEQGAEVLPCFSGVPRYLQVDIENFSLTPQGTCKNACEAIPRVCITEFMGGGIVPGGGLAFCLWVYDLPSCVKCIDMPHGDPPAGYVAASNAVIFRLTYNLARPWPDWTTPREPVYADLMVAVKESWGAYSGCSPYDINFLIRYNHQFAGIPDCLSWARYEMTPNGPDPSVSRCDSSILAHELQIYLTSL
jgi:hypothetical protein